MNHKKNNNRKQVRIDTQTDQILDPGVVSRWADGHLNDSCCDQHDETDRRHILPQVKIDHIGSETKHVLQVLCEPDRRSSKDDK